MKTKLKKVFINLALICATLVLCLVILEIGLRAIGSLPSNTTEGFFQQHGDSYRLKKGLEKLIRTPSYVCRVIINTSGQRDITSGDRPIGQKPYYIFLGESLTFGNGVDYEKSFVGRVAESMKTKGIDVINLAVGGHRFSEQQQVLKDFLAETSKMPEKIIICFSPMFIEGFDQPHSDVLIKNGYIFSKKGWLLPYLRIMVGNSSSAYCFFRDSARRLSRLLFAHNMIDEKKLWGFYSVENRLSDSSVANALELELTEMDRFISEIGAEPIYVYLPLSTDFPIEDMLKKSGKDPSSYDFLFYFKLLGKHCKAKKIPLINLHPEMKRLFDKGIELHFNQDPHYNTEVHRRISEIIEAQLGSNTTD